MGLRSFIRTRFGKRLDDTANECSDYDGIVTVGPEFYDPPDDPWLAGMARGASRAFSDRTLAEPPSHHPIAFRRKGPPDHV
jgi:hypothetical protein